jgi:hypothetical protein
MLNPSQKPHSADKFLGRAFSMLQGFFDGFSTGAGLVKLPIWLKGLTPGLSSSPYVVAGGALAGLLFIVKARNDEKENNQKEQNQLNKKASLGQQIAINLEETLVALTEKLAHEVDVANIRAQAHQQRKSQAEVDAIVRKAIVEKASLKYSHLLEKATPTRSANKQLLKSILRDYVNSFGDEADRYRKARGKFPSQSKIEKLIQRITGFNRYSPGFYDQVCQFLSDDPATAEKYRRLFPDRAVEPPRSFIAQQVDKVRAFWKSQKTLRHVVVGVLGFLGNASAGSGLTASTLKLFGVISAGAPVAWPILAVIAVGGLVYSGIAAVLNYKRTKVRAANLKVLDEEIKASEDKLELSRRLKKIHKNQYKLHLHKDTFDQSQAPERAVRHVVQVKLPTSTYIRMGLGLLGKIITGAADAMMLGLGIAWLGTIAFPALSIIAPTLYIGGGLTSFFIFKSLKEEVKSIKHELATLQEVAEIRQHLQEKHRNKVGFQAELLKDSRILLKEVIQDYVKYVSSLGDNAHVNGKYKRQEKILSLIEQVIGVKRPEDEGGRKLHPLGNDAFYNHLAKFLKGPGENSGQANSIAQSLKSLLVKQPNLNVSLSFAAVNADDPAVNKKQSLWSKGLDFFKNNGLGIVGALCAGFILPLFLAGPQFVIILPVAAVVIGGFAISKIAAHYSEKNVAKLAAEKATYTMIERKYSLQDKTIVAPQAKVAEELAHQDAPLPRLHHGIGEHRTLAVVPKDERAKVTLEVVAAQPSLPESSRARAGSVGERLAGSMKNIWKDPKVTSEERQPLLRTPIPSEVPA